MTMKCLLLLLYPTVSDIQIRKFYIVPIAIISIFFAGIQLVSQPDSAVDILFGCLPGVVALVLCLITKEAIGAGDVAVITGLGVIAGWENACRICLIGLVLCGITGLMLIMFKKADKKTTLPFIPFLTAAVLLLWLIGG